MLSIEPGVFPDSDYYIYTASAQAVKTFFYPVCVGYFHYMPTYHLHRNTYDSFLIMYMKQGECTVVTHGQTYTAKAGQVVVLDCYEPHSYFTNTGWEAEWLHFDGPVAREYFQLITGFQSPVITLKDSFKFEKYLHRIYSMFRENVSIKEALVSHYINTMLTELLVFRESGNRQENQSDIIEETAAYINEHLKENLTLEQLAEKANLSPYYFTRLFKRETGFTPHEYLIAMRVNTAKFLLKNTDASIKEICFNTGFANESSFCTTFKKWVDVTPSVYRTRV